MLSTGLEPKYDENGRSPENYNTSIVSTEAHYRQVIHSPRKITLLSTTKLTELFGQY